MIEVLTTGLANSVQDGGRTGLAHLGVGPGGVMDRVAFAVGNALLGNEGDSAAIEVALFPFRIRFGETVTLSVTGADCGASLDGGPLPPWWARAARAGQVLTLAPPRQGARAYLCVAGGIDVPPVLGSRSTDAKSGFGGFEGRGLRRGDRLALGPRARGRTFDPAGLGAAPPSAVRFARRDRGEPVRLRVLPAAEHEGFTDEALADFGTRHWTISAEANRTGYRLEGPALPTRTPFDLFSHGVVPGVVQVPPSGQPIVQLADANTMGGYPKIATVIGADLWKLAQMRPGDRLCFEIVSREDAVAALRAICGEIAAVREAAALSLA